MPHADAPKQSGRQHEQEPEQRRKHVKPVFRAPRQVQKRVILEQRKRHAIGEKTQHLPAIDGKRVHTKFPSAICEDVHKLQPLRCEEANRSINHEQAREYDDPYGNHQRERQDLIRRPAYAALRQRICTNS